MVFLVAAFAVTFTAAVIAIALLPARAIAGTAAVALTVAIAALLLPDTTTSAGAITGLNTADCIQVAAALGLAAGDF
jgi:hypothetical protein